MNKQDSTPYKSPFFLACSIIAHGLVLLYLKYDIKEFMQKQQQPIEWVKFESSKPKVFLSKTKNRVKKQTRTQQKFFDNKNNFIIPQKEKPTESLSKQTNERKSETQSALDKKIANALELNKTQSQQSTSSAINQYLPQELSIGDAVVLNTDRNIYYSFYKRAIENLYWPWARELNKGFQKLKRSGQLAGGAKTWVTILEVILDKNGKLVSIQPLRLAGLWEVDNAPQVAFEEVQNFPNPPKAMVDEDGYIHIKYRFSVYYRPQR